MAFNSSSNNGSSTGASNNNEESDSTKKKSFVIRVEEDSQAQLNDLFERTLNNELPLHVPYRMRKLPDSFFKPPTSGSKSPSVSVSHSRENSADSLFSSGSTVLGAPPALVNGLPIHHSRAHSSPASLGKINIAGMGGLNTNCNIGNNSHATTAAAAAAAAGLNAKPTLNHNNLNNNTNFNNNAATPSTSRLFNAVHSRGRSYDVSNLQYGNLPSGWEQAKTTDGRIYYIK